MHFFHREKINTLQIIEQKKLSLLLLFRRPLDTRRGLSRPLFRCLVVGVLLWFLVLLLLFPLPPAVSILFAHILSSPKEGPQA